MSFPLPGSPTFLEIVREVITGLEEGGHVPARLSDTELNIVAERFADGDRDAEMIAHDLVAARQQASAATVFRHLTGA